MNSFYDLRSTPRPDTNSFTPRQRKQIQRFNPSCHISSSSTTGICPPYATNIGGCYSGASKNLTGDSSLLSTLCSPSKFLIVSTANSEQFPLASLGTLSRYHRICSALFNLPALSVNLLSGLKKKMFLFTSLLPPVLYRIMREGPYGVRGLGSLRFSRRLWGSSKMSHV